MKSLERLRISKAALRRLAGNVLLALSSTLLLLLVLEAGCRIFIHLEDRGMLAEAFRRGAELPASGPVELGHIIRPAPGRMIYELKPGLDVLYQGARVTTNEDGFRGPQYPAAAKGDARRIVGIGDSFMFGQTVADGETYLTLAEKLLNERQPDPPTQVVNLAVPGYNTVMEVETLRAKGLAYKPDLVVLEVVGNDFELPNFIRKKRAVLALRKSFLADFYRQRIRRHDELKRQRLQEEMEDYGLMPGLGLDAEDVPPEYAGMVGWKVHVETLRDLRKLADEQGFAVVVVALAPDLSRPMRLSMTASRRLGFYVKWIGRTFRNQLDEQGVEYLDSPLASSPTDGHPSALAHRIAARVLADYVLAEELFGRPLKADGLPPDADTWDTDRWLRTPAFERPTPSHGNRLKPGASSTRRAGRR